MIMSEIMRQGERLIKQRIEENYNGANLEDLQKWIDKGKLQQISYRLVNIGTAPCKVKVSKKSQRNLAKIIFK